MIMKDLLTLISKKNRNNKRIKATQKFAVGLGVVATAGVATGILIAPKFSKKARENFKKKAENTIENGQEKAENVKEEVNDAYHEITQDIRETAENISDELKPNRRKTNGK